MPSQENLTDEELIAIIRQNDKELYSEIIRRYQTKLSHYLRKFIRRDDELEDVLQDVFIKAYRNLNDFNVHKRFSPWIYRIAHNEALNMIKKYRKEVVSIDESEWEIIDQNIDLGKSVDASLTKTVVEQALTAMKDKYREPIILYFFEQKSYEEISDILRIPRNTVGTLIMRGKKIIKESLGKTLYGRQT
ncbi:MAG: RNA polymerase sigma factor [Candidatus Magasanikbacteria bacterium]